MDEQKRIERAQQAEQIFKSPIFREAIDNLRNICYRNIETSSRDQQQEREDLYYMLRLLGAFEREFKKIMDEGKATSINLNVRKLAR